MEVYFNNKDLDRLETDPSFLAGFSQDVVKVYRRRMQMIRAALDERDFYALKSLHYEKLKGNRSHQRSMRLNKKWRLILEINEETEKRIIQVVAIEDYHG